MTVTKKPVQVKFEPKIRNKYRKQWKDCKFLTVMADQADLGITENFCNFAKVSYIWGWIFHVFKSALKLINMNMKKCHFCLLSAYTFWVQKSTKALAIGCVGEKNNFNVYSSNKIRKAQNEHVNIVCQNLKSL